ncbi:MAG: DUF2905 domain-containing protein [candidate division Zixibacteria bacterium]|nr:DUF2905 domain-containing protein [candidate division Zixibacteria bacterium]
MWEFHSIGRILVVLGIIIFAVSLLLIFADRILLLGKFPGDLFIKRKNFVVYFPLATSILLSLLLTLILYLWRR